MLLDSNDLPIVHTRILFPLNLYHNLHFFVIQAEIYFLGDLIHPNLVKLIGYSIEDDQRLLVYEFLPRGSLENHLFRSKQLFLSHFFSLSACILEVALVNTSTVICISPW